MTGQEYDGSDSGAKPDEAVSWGKIKLEASPVKVTKLGQPSVAHEPENPAIPCVYVS